MTNEKRRLSIITALLMSFFILVGMGNEVYAASVGQRLTQPEEGWSRYDDADENITYTKVLKRSNSASGYYNSTVTEIENNGEIKFNFTGTKLRIIGYKSPTQSKIELFIDGKSYGIFDPYVAGANPTQILMFDINELKDGAHSVIMMASDNKNKSGLDAIDIDENGELLPYDPDINNNSGIILDIEPEKEKIRITEEVYADLTIDNIKEIAAEDVRIQYDNEKLDFLGFEEVEGIKLVKSIEDLGNGELRVILASKGESNIVNFKETLLRLRFKGKAIGEAKVDIIKARVSDGIEMEKDLTDEQCDEGIIIIEGINDVNNSGEFTLLDLAIDARHLNKDPNSFPQYNTDIVVNGAIDEDDLLEIARLMLENPNYAPNI